MITTVSNTSQFKLVFRLGKNVSCANDVQTLTDSLGRTKLIREIKLDVTWSYVKRQMAKLKLLPSVFSSLNSRVKILEFVVNSRRHFFFFL